MVLVKWKPHNSHTQIQPEAAAVLMGSEECLFPRPQISNFPLGSPCISAYSKTTGNCQDSDSSSPSHSDQYHHVSNASGLVIQAMKKRRRREAHSHKLSYKKRRRDKINKQMLALRNLIPNCSKLDKESVLDEAIEYLKSLQLQLQIITTFAGLCVPPIPIIFPALGSSIDFRLEASGLRLFG